MVDAIPSELPKTSAVGDNESGESPSLGLGLGSLAKRINQTLDKADRITGGSKLALSPGSFIFPAGMMAILAIMLIPLPTFLLDGLLTISIALSLLIMMAVVFAENPVKFSTFPMILLIAAMFRLSLNVASTRIILSEGKNGTGAAGHIIEAFGQFVAGGNFVIGTIIFIILMIINFVVITKGAGRIAEVAARFTLDALPGKQLSIDADLSSGLITEAEAKQKRKDLEAESKFYGSMDGASKFVRGDAVAGLLITGINVVGGIIIGVAQGGLTLSKAAEIYTILTIGDGLVSTIPSLIVSTAAGLLATKAGVEEKIDSAIGKQLGTNVGVLIVAAVTLLLMAFIPKMPPVPFILLAAVLGFFALVMRRRAQRDAVDADKPMDNAETQKAENATPDEPIQNSLQIDLVRMELGYSLLSLLNEGELTLTQLIKNLRKQLASEFGFVMPSVRIQDNLELPGNNYVIRVKEIEEGVGELRPKMLMVMDPKGDKVTIPGEPAVEPVYKIPAVWVTENMREDAHFRGYTVVDPCTIITTHLTEILKDNMADLLSYAETRKLIDDLPEQHKKLADELIPNKISVSDVQRVLQNLLRERVSIRDLASILEGMALAFSSGITSINRVTEWVRVSLNRQISHQYLNADKELPIIHLSEEWEQAFVQSLQGNGEEKNFVMQPSLIEQFIANVDDLFGQASDQGHQAILLTSGNVRRFVRLVVERSRTPVPVIAQAEIHPRTKVRTLGQL